ncbi:hypothetical protein OH214_06680 [Idiomarina abyssalis]|uniref:hypothetical protein n=1 Tax=Idiomarina abyssalis TaxID=86102 RepID=UPI00230190EB|nr:hypothetical protein [Idiomarina abyssalis]MDA6066808.1 hypothetical protein [Idiomarina abyssalis]
MQYQKELMEAVARSKRFGISEQDISLCSERYYSDDRLVELISVIDEAYGGISMERLLGKCAQVHFDFLADIRRIFHPGALFTLGYVCLEENEYFKFGEPDIKSWLRKGLNPDKMNLHAWVTLPSLEIIDLTFPATFAYVNKIEEFGIAITKHVSELEGMSYHPMLAGEESVFKLGVVKSIRFTI